MSGSEKKTPEHKNESDSNNQSAQAIEENNDTTNENNLTKKRQFLDQKFKTFFENICSQAMEDIDESQLEENQSNIYYGNVSNKYDPNKSITTIEKINELPNENQFENLPPNIIELLIETSNEMFKEKDINLNKKDCLLHLIERNRKNMIFCPFDELAFFKIKRLDTKILSKIDYQINKIIIFDSKSVMDLMPNCLSTFMLQFFFEIFQPSELKNFTRKTLDLMLKLKNSLKPESYFDSNYKTMHLEENVLCNSFALYKYKFCLKYKIGFLNYILSLYCLAENIAEDSKIKRLVRLLPHFLRGLVLNGFLNRADIFDLELKLASISSEYKENFLADVNKILNRNKLMALKSMSRIVVRQNLIGYGHDEITKLKLDKKCREFLEFESELESMFEENELKDEG